VRPDCSQATCSLGGRNHFGPSRYLTIALTGKPDGLQLPCVHTEKHRKPLPVMIPTARETAAHKSGAGISSGAARRFPRQALRRQDGAGRAVCSCPDNAARGLKYVGGQPVLPFTVHATSPTIQAHFTPAPPYFSISSTFYPSAAVRIDINGRLPVHDVRSPSSCPPGSGVSSSGPD